MECKLCIEACPTNALYWKSGKVGVTEELCVFCTACVLSCIVDDCIKVERRRPNGGMEEFSTPEQALRLLNSINSRKRCEMTKRLLPTVEAYLERYLR
ncbi:MAG: 4Fe-4S binding protein [Candidatus Bathyarchaeia archaeon]